MQRYLEIPAASQQPAACSQQPAASNQLAACSLQLAACSLQPAAAIVDFVLQYSKDEQKQARAGKTKPKQAQQCNSIPAHSKA